MDFNVFTLIGLIAVTAGVIFTILPVLPGSFIALAGLLVWAIGESNPVGWGVFAVCGILLAAGASMQILMTGRTMRRHRIPNRSVVVGVVAGVILMFIVPIVGLPLGFAAGLFGMELARQRDIGLATRSSVAALKATGVGILVEFGLAAIAATIFVGALLFSSSV
ncbi:DUF456 domain-containing protein [Falsarthrobacter nasiphocae]|uniref:Uncharacterized protein YqgC (DUF456 family) n=1 Tax=Falsarthrobacter nasiphocae TaxID=189863 RepID=A0AAE3YHM8_9MICC|nr:DUF456 domain-containing protein [Falsarthrobacter nasiphocae]MDR6892196.1 uncharacterized protein YqgC (DUF456 family) [Falsarthrobacter nasiphocae]